MILGNPSIISNEKYDQLIQLAAAHGYSWAYDSTKHQLEISDSERWLIKVFLPWNASITDNAGLKLKDDFHLGLVMIRAGQAATGHFHNGELLDHKVFRAYMVRKKQGKSQIKHLKTKGKSRAGSRVRLEETTQFFEEINERLQRYNSQYAISTWGLSCAKTLLPYFLASETPPPFRSKQNNLLKIPFHVQQPDFITLQKIHNKLNAVHVIASENGKLLFDQIKPEAPSSAEDEEDW